MTTGRNTQVETSRLKIIPLGLPELRQYLQANDLFEKEAGLQQNGREVAPDVKELVTKFTIPRMEKAHDGNYLFYTFWIVVEKSTQCIVAELGFKGEPNGKAEIEIGYGTMPSQRGKGFMTEAVGAMITWARLQPDVSYMLAEADEANTASIRVLQKNYFDCFDKRKKMLWWRVDVK
jgi:ribosomal-protein-alanine N-acetyltransferase